MKILKFTFFMNFLSKWIVIQQLTFCSSYFLLTILLMMTLITLFFYINYKMNLYLILTFLSIFGLFLMSMFYFMF